MKASYLAILRSESKGQFVAGRLDSGPYSPLPTNWQSSGGKGGCGPNLASRDMLDTAPDLFYFPFASFGILVTYMRQ
jgi:hypothetical protein